MEPSSESDRKQDHLKVNSIWEQGPEEPQGKGNRKLLVRHRTLKNRN